MPCVLVCLCAHVSVSECCGGWVCLCLYACACPYEYMCVWGCGSGCVPVYVSPGIGVLIAMSVWLRGVLSVAEEACVILHCTLAHTVLCCNGVIAAHRPQNLLHHAPTPTIRSVHSRCQIVN